MMLLATVTEPGFASELLRVLLLDDYNTRVVVAGTTVLGAAAGLIGSFLLLRKRALMGDALSHAMLPGVVLAFMVMVALGGTGKSLPGLLAGALVFGLIGVGAVLAIRANTRIKDDAAMGIVLSVFFGFGIVLLRLVQAMPESSAAGLSSFIYGKTASMTASDVQLIGGIAVLVVVVCLVFYKELCLLCFDEAFARTQGWPTRRLDILLMSLIAVVTVIGLQAVGLILVIAMLVIPPAAARFWTERLGRLMLISAVIGVISGWFGSAVSALVPRMPAGAVIVVVTAGVFVFSMIFGSSRGVLRRFLRERRGERRVREQHLLRGLYEIREATSDSSESIALERLLPLRSWRDGSLRRIVGRAQRAGLVRSAGRGAVALTARGERQAARVVRNHRLWETYLITYADIAPSHVDRDADQIEHILGEELVAELEAILGRGTANVPASPHGLEMT